MAPDAAADPSQPHATHLSASHQSNRFQSNEGQSAHCKLSLKNSIGCQWLKRHNQAAHGYLTPSSRSTRGDAMTLHVQLDVAGDNTIVASQTPTNHRHRCCATTAADNSSDRHMKRSATHTHAYTHSNTQRQPAHTTLPAHCRSRCRVLLYSSGTHSDCEMHDHRTPVALARNMDCQQPPHHWHSPTATPWQGTRARTAARRTHTSTTQRCAVTHPSQQDAEQQRTRQHESALTILRYSALTTALETAPAMHAQDAH
jgi:hypothetical protein